MSWPNQALASREKEQRGEEERAARVMGTVYVAGLEFIQRCEWECLADSDSWFCTTNQQSPPHPLLHA